MSRRRARGNGMTRLPPWAGRLIGSRCATSFSPRVLTAGGWTRPSRKSTAWAFAITKLPTGPGYTVYNAYPLMHSMGIYQGQRATTDKKRVVILTRSAYAGQQRNSAITWSGDITGTW